MIRHLLQQKTKKLVVNLVEVRKFDCLQSDADSRIILHVSNCIQMGLIIFYVRANDTGVVVLLIAFMPDFLKINAGVEVIAICDVGTQKYCMLINVTAEI